jgi:tetratricopeptide (TPR) repeat protein
MQFSEWLPVFARIALPCVLAVVLQLQPVLEQVPMSLKAAALAEQAGDKVVAAQSYARLAQIQPWRGGLLEKAGLLYYEANNRADAIRVLQQALERGVLSLVGQAALAEAYYSAGNYDQALSVWLPLLDSPAADENLFAEIAAKLGTAGLIDAQTSMYARRATRFPQDARVLYQLGLLQAIGAPAEAAANLRRAAGLDGSLSAPVETMLEALENTQFAYESYRLVITGRALGNLGEWAIARRAFERAVELEPAYAEAWAFLAESLQQLEKPALKAIQQANELAPDSIGVKAISAAYWRRQRDYARALEIVQEIRRLQPEETAWLVELGSISADSGDMESALQYFQQAVAAEPQNGRWLKEMINFCLRNNYAVRSTALPAAREYLRLSEESVGALESMGAVMWELQDTLSAERYVWRALKLDPANADAHLLMGRICLQKDRLPQAYTHLTAAQGQAYTPSETALLAGRLLEQYFPEGASPEGASQ